MDRLRCWLGLHKRSRGMTRYGEDGSLRSHCRRCRTPMLLNLRNVWIVDAERQAADRAAEKAREAEARAHRKRWADMYDFVREVVGVDLLPKRHRTLQRPMATIRVRPAEVRLATPEVEPEPVYRRAQGERR